MEKKKSEFDKVFSAWDILVIAFGAMIGWGWVVSTGDWIGRGGVLGAFFTNRLSAPVPLKTPWLRAKMLAAAVRHSTTGRCEFVKNAHKIC